MTAWLQALVACVGLTTGAVAVALVADLRLGVPGPYSLMLAPFVVLAVAAAVVAGLRATRAGGGRDRVRPSRATRPVTVDGFVLFDSAPVSERHERVH